MLAEQMNNQTLNMNFILIRMQMSVGIRLHDNCFVPPLCKWHLDKSFKPLVQCLGSSHSPKQLLDHLFLRVTPSLPVSVKPLGDRNRETLDPRLHFYNLDQGPCKTQQLNELAGWPSSSCRETAKIFPQQQYFLLSFSSINDI